MEHIWESDITNEDSFREGLKNNYEILHEGLK